LSKVLRSNTYKQVDVGNEVVLDHDYLVAHHKPLQQEIQAKQLLTQAQAQAQQMIEEAQQQAQQILAAAEERAQRIVVEEGQQQRDAILQQAQEEGFRAGLSQGIAQMREEMAAHVYVAEQVFERALEAQQSVIFKHRFQLANLIRYLVQTILGEELKTTPDQVLNLLERAVRQLQVTGEAKIAVSYDVFQLLQEHCAEAIAQLSANRRVIIQPDPTCTGYDMYLFGTEAMYAISPESQAEAYMASVEAVLKAEADADREAMVSFIQNGPAEEISEQEPLMVQESDEALS
jgi:flagellar assembly protein FliH